MSRQPVSVGGRADATEFRQELLGRLGLRDNASDQDVEAAHNGLVDFLELAPHEVKSWATARTTDVDEAFALLSGPEEDLLPPALPVVTATPEGPVSLDKDVVSESPAPPAFSARPMAPAPAAPGRRWPQRTQLVWAIVPLLVVGIVLAVYYMGKGSDVPGISGTPTNQATTAPAAAKAAPLDQAKVGALMQKITANPKDVASLAALGDLYFASADYKNAALFEQKILAIDPKNQTGLLALGAAQFNQADTAGAKKTWLVAAGLYPKSAVVHYDLGFLYFSQTPPDIAKMTAEWKQVIAIDPNSDIAKTVATHIKGATATPTAK
jgi:cytochrome c-type biogenesis protein CcmH/NrfG